MNMIKITLWEVFGGGDGMHGQPYSMGYFETLEEAHQFMRNLNYGQPTVAPAEVMRYGDKVFIADELKWDYDDGRWTRERTRAEREFTMLPEHEEANVKRAEIFAEQERLNEDRKKAAYKIPVGGHVWVTEARGNEYEGVVVDRDTLDKTMLVKHRKGRDSTRVYSNRIYVLPKGNRKIRELDPPRDKIEKLIWSS